VEPAERRRRALLGGDLRGFELHRRSVRRAGAGLCWQGLFPDADRRRGLWAGVRERAMLRDEVRGELGRNAIALAEVTELGVEFRIAAVAPAFRAQVADALRRPEARHERIARGMRGERDATRPAHRTVAGRALDHERGVVARTGVAGEHDEILSGEQVQRALRLESVESYPVRMNVHVR